MSDVLSTRQQQRLLLSATGPCSASLDLEPVIDEILSWLPVKSLLRFRSVCKAWRALISDPDFITKHLIRVNTNNLSFIIHETSKPIFRSIDYEALLNYSSSLTQVFVSIRELDFPVKQKRLSKRGEIIGCCNGLICLLLDPKTSVFMLWNPCTGEFNVLPKPPIKKPPNFYGFGYDSTSNDYKVIVGTFDFDSNDGYVVVAFCLKTGSWRNVRSLNRNFRVLGKGCLVNGALHWVDVHELYEDGGVDVVHKIVSFDLAEEKFHEIAFPNPVCLCARVENVGNSLALVYVDRLDFKCTMWVMKEYGVERSWNEVMKIPQEFKPLCIFDDGVTLIQLLDAVYDDGRSKSVVLLLYNPKERLRFITKSSVSETAAYIETLVSPLTGSGV